MFAGLQPLTGASVDFDKGAVGTGTGCSVDLGQRLTMVKPSGAATAHDVRLVNFKRLQPLTGASVDSETFTNRLGLKSCVDMTPMSILVNLTFTSQVGFTCNAP